VIPAAKCTSIARAKKFPIREEAEKIAAETAGTVGILRIVDGLKIREVYAVEYPHDSTLRFARRAKYDGRPCFFAGFAE
jgi:hypothetical protein